MIDHYSFGKIIIDGVTYTSDIKIIDGNVIPNWWRKDGHSICKEDIEDIIDAIPDIFILGTGNFGFLKVPTEFIEYLKKIDIELVAEKTEKACELYNNHAKDKKVAFGAHLTC
jgi:hypothetical protein